MLFPPDRSLCLQRGSQHRTWCWWPVPSPGTSYRYSEEAGAPSPPSLYQQRGHLQTARGEEERGSEWEREEREGGGKVIKRGKKGGGRERQSDTVIFPFPTKSSTHKVHKTHKTKSTIIAMLSNILLTYSKQSTLSTVRLFRSQLISYLHTGIPSRPPDREFPREDPCQRAGRQASPSPTAAPGSSAPPAQCHY